MIVTGEPVKPTKTTKFASKDSKKPDKKKLVGVVIAAIVIFGIILLSIRNNQTKRDEVYVDEDSIVWVEDAVAVDTCVADSFPELTPITRDDEQDKGYKEQNKRSNNNSSDQGTVPNEIHSKRTIEHDNSTSPTPINEGLSLDEIDLLKQ